MNIPIRPLAEVLESQHITHEEYIFHYGRGDEQATPKPGQLCRFKDEKEFQNWLMTQFVNAGWLYMHQWGPHAKRNAAGFPDTRALDPPHSVVAELKMPDQTPSEDQVRWLNAEARVSRGPFQKVCLWYPEHEGEILAYIASPSKNAPPGLWSPKEEAI